MRLVGEVNGMYLEESEGAELFTRYNVPTDGPEVILAEEIELSGSG